MGGWGVGRCCGTKVKGYGVGGRAWGAGRCCGDVLGHWLGWTWRGKVGGMGEGRYVWEAKCGEKVVAWR